MHVYDINTDILCLSSVQIVRRLFKTSTRSQVLHIQFKMSMSGVQVSEEAKNDFQTMKTSSGANKKDLFVMQILKGEDNKEKLVPTMDGVGNSYTNDDFRQFLDDFLDDDGKAKPCIAIHDFSVSANSNKRVLIGLSWVPDSCKIQQKTIYAASLEGIKPSFAVKWIGSYSDTADLTDNEIRSALPPSALN